MKIKTIFILSYVIIGQLMLSAQQTDREKYDAYVADRKLNAGNKYTYSQFAVALRYRDTLGLNSTQVDRLYQEAAIIKNMKNNNYTTQGHSLDTRAYESTTMTQVLTSQQYIMAMRLKNHTKAKSMAEEAWAELVAKGQTTGLNSTVAQQELYEYYVVRESIYDRFRHDILTRQAELKAHFLDRPAVVTLLYKSRRSPANNTMGGGYNGQN